MIHQLRFLVACVASAALVYGDLSHNVFADVRQGVSLVLLPFRAVADLPQSTYQLTANYLADREHLLAQKTQLEQTLLESRVRLQTLDYFISQNRALRRLLEVQEATAGQWVAARVQTNIAQPLVERIYLNKGTGDGIGVGMGVVDPDGAIGQVVRVDTNTSAVNLLTDGKQWVATYNARTQLLVLLRGDGGERLVVEHASKDADIQTGDRLLAALGSVFPPGYPVAVVDSVAAGALYLAVTAKPLSNFWDNDTLMVYASEDNSEDGGEGESAATAGTQPQ